MVPLRVSSKAMHPGTVSTLLQELITHLLYMRQQIPIPLCQVMCGQQQDSRPSARRSANSTFRNAIEQLMTDIELIIASGNVRDVLIVFGNSLQSTHEVYKVAFNLDPGSAAPSPRKMKAYVREFIRQLISAPECQAIFVAPLRICKMFVLVSTSRDSPVLPECCFLPKMR